ncbi:Anthocyanidin 3-O-glucosyltransferase [Glycine soja]|nr:Anthocyanidin 3-O-glucosyltransferase [Glycine soja]
MASPPMAALEGLIHGEKMPSEVVNNCELHVVMFPFLAFGHISPFVQLSNKLFSHGFPNGIANTAELPPHLAGNLIHALDLTQDQVKSLLLELKPHYVFFDFAQNWIPKLASEVGIKSVHFSVYSAISDASITVPSRFDDVEGRNITFEDLK